MKNKNKTVWGPRFKSPVSKIFEKIGASIDVDKRLFEEDIFGSIVHTQMLVKQKIIDKAKGKKIINGLKKINNENKKNKFVFSKKYEDIHLNIEKRLFSIIGADAGYLHIARSRNDQVITDFKLWVKKASKEIIINLNTLIKTLEKNLKSKSKTKNIRKQKGDMLNTLGDNKKIKKYTNKIKFNNLEFGLKELIDNDG